MTWSYPVVPSLNCHLLMVNTAICHNIQSQGDLFIMPEERTMNMEEFLDIIDDPETASGVFYIQKQNSNLTEEFVELMGEVDEDIGWASEAFNKKPDAVNFWMGDARAVTSSNSRKSIERRVMQMYFQCTRILTRMCTA